MIKLDENYNIVLNGDQSIYHDELSEKVDKILKLHQVGKITQEEAKKLIKHVFSFYLEDEIKETFNAMLISKQKRDSNKVLFLRYLNEELYA